MNNNIFRSGKIMVTPKLKNVKFNNIVNVILVPTIKEYKDLHDNIWWSKEEILKTRLHASADLNSLILLTNIQPSQSFEDLLELNECENTILEIKKEKLRIAMKLLYQPDKGKYLVKN